MESETPTSIKMGVSDLRFAFVVKLQCEFKRGYSLPMENPTIYRALTGYKESSSSKLSEVRACI